MFREIDKRIKRALGGVRQAFRMVIGQVNSAPGVQLVTGDANAGEPVRDAELMQHYGFTSRPPAGTMAVVLPLGGKSSHGIIVATENSAYRIAGLENGELAIYTHEGAKTVFRNGRVIESDCDIWRLNCRRFEVNASEHSDFSTPVLETDAQAIVRGKLTGEGGMALSGGQGAQIEGGLHATQDIVAGSVSLQGHDHPGDSGGLTGKPRA
ncbi:hypothetical protein LMG26858_00855 [Achromobacter anxifer]|uniref:Bacteriophage Mu Gp45 N-terminal domain-containing protein n=1 Tax=Achromobacter anxifer TaxID=1287737 RepID=A0A6S7CJF1_9BURK|nr:phage baseplate assembly protein V [Achromobacter anxifer]CAB3834283.1 hypothetical protein LMG26858_00855 [Achromobacter anxifer]